MDDMVRDPHTGANQSGLRDQNARLILSYIRRHGGMAGAEIARRSGLSAQTVSNILRALEGDGLLRRGKTVKGKVGKPSVPMELNPTGVFALGLNIGRRTAEIVLVDFKGTLVAARSIAYPYPEVDTVLDFLRSGTQQIFAQHPVARGLTTGLGVSRPTEIWKWLEQVGAPASAMDRWQQLDLESELSKLSGLDVDIGNDATSACLAEHLLGLGAQYTDYAYIFIGAFIGGGLVMNGKVVWGRTGNSGAIGILPVRDGSGRQAQLLDFSSLYVLETTLSKSGIDPAKLRQHPDDWSNLEPHVSSWVDTTSEYLALTAASIASVVEVEAVMIDGAMPSNVLEDLMQRTGDQFSDIDLSGIDRPVLRAGTIGRSARSIGAALLPIHSRYFTA